MSVFLSDTSRFKKAALLKDGPAPGQYAPLHLVSIRFIHAVYVYVVPWSELPIVPSYPHICSAMVKKAALLKDGPVPGQCAPLPERERVLY